MKIRQGFVSNSSSSSFLIVGNYVDYDELNKYREKAKKIELEKDLTDNGYYDPREYHDCKPGACDCDVEHRCFIGYGSSGFGGYGTEQITMETIRDWERKAKKLFGGEKVVIIFGEDGNE